MIFGLFIPFIIIATVILGIRQLSHGASTSESRNHLVRRFFQYSMLLVALIISATGLAGLLFRILNSGEGVASDSVALARDASFAIVGVPVLFGLSMWTRNTMRKDAREMQSLAWGSFLTVADTVSLAIGLIAASDFAAWATNLPDTTWPLATARVSVWGLTWVSIRLVKRAYSTSQQRQAGNLIGSAIGLGMTITGAVAVISSMVQIAFGLQNDIFISQSNDATVRGTITLVLGASVWAGFWYFRARVSEHNNIWNTYVLLLGVGGAFITVLTSASMVIYQTLVWNFGSPNVDIAKIHFNDTPVAGAYVLMGVATWWYHRRVLHDAGRRQRTEVRRVYEYMISALSLGSLAVGIGILVVAAIESATNSYLITSSTSNTLLTAVTLLGVGTPVWWMYWSRIQRFAHTEPETEAPTPTRRAYLFILFGIGGVASLVALITGVYFLLRDIFQSEFGTLTLRTMRFPIGVLVTTGILAAYHYLVYRHERQYAQVAWHHTRNIMLVGPKDEGLAAEIQKRTGDHVQIWVQTNADGQHWSQPEVLALVDDLPDQDALILLNSHGLEIIPVVRA